MRRLMILLVGMLLNSGCSVFGIRTAEELKYTVVETSHNLEIRAYDPYISARASMAGEFADVQGPLFRVLAGYIFGKNSTDSSIAMTAPVQMKGRKSIQTKTPPPPSANNKAPDEKIAMTAPVLLVPDEVGTWTMKFSMPSEYTMSTIPKPVDDRITLVDEPAHTVAVFRYSGALNDLQLRRSNAELLLAKLASDERYDVVGQPYFAGYDPPFTLPFLRRNEVLVEVRRR